jgi:plastocyanin
MRMHRIRPYVVMATAAGALACGSSSGPSNGGQPQQQFGVVSGTVTEAGTGVAGATLQLSRTGAPARNATSSATGAYQFDQVEVGTWSLVITPPEGFNISGAGTATVTVTANATATANFQLERIDSPPQTGTVEVAMMTGNTFSPADVTVAPGTTVRWRNEDNLEHNSTGTGGTWASPNIGSGATFEHQFNEVGTFNYSCTLHAGMNGVVRVQQP